MPREQVGAQERTGRSAPSPALRSAGSQIAVIAKAGAAMDVLLDTSAGVTPSELAERLGANVNTAFRILVSLETAELVDRDPSTGATGSA